MINSVTVDSFIEFQLGLVITSLWLYLFVFINQIRNSKNRHSIKSSLWV